MNWKIGFQHYHVLVIILMNAKHGFPATHCFVLRYAYRSCTVNLSNAESWTNDNLYIRIYVYIVKLVLSQ